MNYNTTQVYREFGTYDEDGRIKGDCGTITLNVSNNNKIELFIDGLHDDDMVGQAFMLIDYDKKCDLYDCIEKILDVLSYDLYYVYYSNESNKINRRHKDIILNHNNENIEREIWNIDTDIRTNKGSNIWMAFIRDNIKYVEIGEPYDFYYQIKDDFFVLKGKVTENYDFSYDSPIINSCSDKDYYLETRGMKQTELSDLKVIIYDKELIKKLEEEASDHDY
jgi:hypothetical protein